MPKVDFTEDELLALAVIKADDGDLKPEYAAAHARARRKCADAYVEARTAGLYFGEHERESPTLNLAKRVAVDQAAIRSLITDAAGDRNTLVMEYEDRDGERTTRRIIPSTRGVFSSIYGIEYIGAHDIDKDEPRTFRVERIKRLELA